MNVQPTTKTKVSPIRCRKQYCASLRNLGVDYHVSLIQGSSTTSLGFPLHGMFSVSCSPNSVWFKIAAVLKLYDAGKGDRSMVK